MRRKKSFREKLADAKDLPRVEVIPEGMRRQWGEGTMVLPGPREVADLMASVPRGKVTTINQLRETLARRHGTTSACPIVTGILARIVAGAAGEEEAEGSDSVTPYWRTLKAGGEVNAKYPGGLEGQRARLEPEGHELVTRGRRLFVRNYERVLARLE